MNENTGVNITLELITKDNWRKAIELKVNEDQQYFVAPNVRSIAESSFYETAYNYGILKAEEIVGFILIYLPPEEPELGHIVRFIVDEIHQGKGYGKQGLIQLIELLSLKFEITVVTLTVIPENQGARSFYENVGFIDTKEIVDGELKYRYTIK